jgi:hypothetical protein
VATLGTPNKIRDLQRALYMRAKKEPKFRFYALYDKVYRVDILEHAYRLARANGGAPGPDGVTFEQIEQIGPTVMLEELHDALKTKTYRPGPVRRVYIPKLSGGERPLGIPNIRDRVVQTAAKLVLEPIFEADFDPDSYGFRPKRDAHQALDAIKEALDQGLYWIIDADLASYLETSSHCTPCVDVDVEETRMRLRDANTQAVSSARADMDRVELAALYTLQDGLARNAEDPHGVDHWDVAGGCFFDEACAQIVGDTDLPRRSGRDLFGGDEAVVDPAVDSRRGDAEELGRLLHGDELAFGGLRSLAARDLPVRA